MPNNGLWTINGPLALQNVSLSLPGTAPAGLADGQTITLSGTFDALTDATPWLFDRFNGTVGNDLTGYTLSKNAGVNPQYAADSGRVYDTAIGKTAKMRFIEAVGQYNCTAERTDLGGRTKIYVSYHCYVDHIAGAASRNVKLLRVTDAFDGSGYPPPTFGHTSFFNTSSGQDYYNNGAFTAIWNAGVVPTGQWFRTAYYASLGTQNTADGIFKLYRNQSLEYNNSALIMRQTGLTANYEWLTLPYYVAHDAGGDYAIYVGHLYVSREEHQQARIELSNSATYTGGDLVVQPMVSCSINLLSFTLVKGSLDLSQPVYAYYTDKAGTTTAKGAI